MKKLLLGSSALLGAAAIASPVAAEEPIKLTVGGFFKTAYMVVIDDDGENELGFDRNTDGFSAPSYTLVDVRAGLQSVRLARVTVSPWVAVTNLFDEYYVASVVPNAAAATPAAARYYDPGPARSFQIGLRASWGAPD